MTAHDPVQKALSNQDLMRIWGEFNAVWDGIEEWLYVAFDSLVRDDPLATRAIFYSQRSHAARLDMVKELAKCILRDDPEKFRALSNAIKRVKARSGTRHELAHGAWNEDYDEQGNEVIQRMPHTPGIMDGLTRAKAKPELEQATNQMKDTLECLKSAIRPLSDAKRQNRIESWKRTATAEERAAFEDFEKRRLKRRLKNEQDS